MNALLTWLYPFDWLVVALVAGAGLWRILRGPTILDRMLGLDALTVAMTALIALECLRSQKGDYMELILVVTALSFFTTVTFYYYLSQTTDSTGGDINQEDPTGPSQRPPCP